MKLRTLSASAALLAAIALAIAAPAAQAANFFDSFDGPKGSVGSPWIIKDAAPGSTACKGPFLGSCPAANNVFKNGSGQLVLRVRRAGTGFRGAVVGTMDYTGVWPTAHTLTWTPPFTVKVRATMPNTPGLWINIPWFTPANTAAQGIFELDQAEERTFRTLNHQTFVHFFKDGVKVKSRDWKCDLALATPITQAHVYQMTVATAWISFRVDGRLCGTVSNLTVPAGARAFTADRFAPYIKNVVGNSAWSTGGTTPTGTGPWDMKVDSFSVTQP
jgi:hypothetical protein